MIAALIAYTGRNMLDLQLNPNRKEFPVFFS